MPADLLVRSLAGLLVFSTVLSAVAMIDSSQRARHAQAVRSDAVLYASVIRARLEGALNQRLRIAYGLAAFARSHFDELPANFAEYADALWRSGVPGLRSLQLAPDAVVTHVYPVAGNETVIGHDLLADPDRRPAVQRAIEQRLFVLGGPVDLIQGGRGLIARLPIYRGETGADKPRFWGFATIVLDAGPLFAEAGLATPHPTYDVAVRGVDGLGAAGRVFVGDTRLFASNAVLLSVALPAGSWQVAVIPKGGWPTAAPASTIIWGIGLVAAALATSVVLLLIMAPDKLRKEVKRATDALRESEEQFRRVAESATDGIVSSDLEGRIVFWNQAATRIFGFPAGEIMGQPVNRLIPERLTPHHDTAIREISKRNGLRRAGHTFSAIGLRKDGTEFPIEISNAAWTAGGKTYLTAIIRDVTARKLAEREQALLQQRFYQAQRMEAIGTLASGAAHVFNNILNTMLANAETASLAPGDEKSRQAIGSIQEGAWKAAEIVRQLLVFAEDPGVEAVPVSLATAARETITQLRSQAPVWQEIDMQGGDGDRGLIMADRGQIQQIIVTLATNAVQALNGGVGRVTVTVRRVDGPHCGMPETSLFDCDPLDMANAEVGAVSRWPAIALSVADNGCGMSRATLNRVFEPFFTTRPVGAGLGLGLSVLHGVVQRCEGAIAVRSCLGKGTIFTILFPALEEEPDRAA